MREEYSVSVVVPIYNERENLIELHRQLVQALGGYRGNWEIILVDDGSTDGSPTVLRDLAANDPWVRVVMLRRNFGQTAAMLAGIAAIAIADTDGVPSSDEPMYPCAGIRYGFGTPMSIGVPSTARISTSASVMRTPLGSAAMSV